MCKPFYLVNEMVSLAVRDWVILEKYLDIFSKFLFVLTEAWLGPYQEENESDTKKIQRSLKCSTASCT